jgi:thiol-disulfide isomerase/thioredoxin
MKMQRNILAYCMIAIIFTSIGIYFGLKKEPVQTPRSPATAALFMLSLPDSQGHHQALSQWAGKALVVNFWAPWCAPCVQEMPELSALQAELNEKVRQTDQGTKSHSITQILGIGIDSASNIAEFSTKHPLNYPLYVSGIGGTEISRQFGNINGSLPFTVLIGGDGQVRKTYLGRLKLDELRQDISSL